MVLVERMMLSKDGLEGALKSGKSVAKAQVV